MVGIDSVVEIEDIKSVGNKLVFRYCNYPPWKTRKQKLSLQIFAKHCNISSVPRANVCLKRRDNPHESQTKTQVTDLPIVVLVRPNRDVFTHTLTAHYASTFRTRPSLWVFFNTFFRGTPKKNFMSAILFLPVQKPYRGQLLFPLFKTHEIEIRARKTLHRFHYRIISCP